MNGDSFYEWFCGILPLLDDNSIIEMDNASYHSVKLDPAPTMAWQKHKIIQWLEDKNVVVDTKMVKLELMQKVKEIRTTENMVGGKNHVKQNNITFKLNDKRQLLIDGVQRVTPEMWANFTKHTISEEDKMWDIESITDEMLDELAPTSQHVLTITGETSTDSSD
ncbi:uncharacterized protein LOC126553843 [Aphis gossypii]|uniref:uncharacterized protein LOC126553843 n=1 Tax=Aphis gossypii TaxID=80765 RepID=UPI0021593259|nr:uncharacterized protein LOC126553843 [Aphis gossypii]